MEELVVGIKDVVVVVGFAPKVIPPVVGWANVVTAVEVGKAADPSVNPPCGCEVAKKMFSERFCN